MRLRDWKMAYDELLVYFSIVIRPLDQITDNEKKSYKFVALKSILFKWNVQYLWSQFYQKKNYFKSTLILAPFNF